MIGDGKITLRESLKNWNPQFSPLVFFDFIIVALALYYFSTFGLLSADQYMSLIFIGVILLVFILFTFREGEIIGDIAPINKSLDKDILVRFLGYIAVILMFGFTIISGFNLFNPALMAPLAQFSTASSPETFAAIKASSDPFTYGFIVIFGASRIEESILGMLFVLAGVCGTYLFVLIYFGILNRTTAINKLHSKTIKCKKTLFIGGMILSLFFFTILHIHNQTYADNPNLFLFAFLFRLFLNLVIYKFFFLGLSFSIAFHEMWNAIAIGSASLIAFLSDPRSWILILFDVLLLYYSIVRFPLLWKEFKKIITFKSSLLK